MPGPDPHDDTSRDYERFEKEQLAQDRDAISVDTADIDDTAGRLPSWLDDRPRRRHGGRVMQQTLVGCAFCDAPPGTETGEAHTWGQDERVTHPICVDCAIQTEPDPDECDHVACDGCGLVVDTLAALTRFRVELGHLEGPLQLCARCSPGGLATYWTRDLEEHLVATPAE